MKVIETIISTLPGEHEPVEIPSRPSSLAQAIAIMARAVASHDEDRQYTRLLSVRIEF